MIGRERGLERLEREHRERRALGSLVIERKLLAVALRPEFGGAPFAGVDAHARGLGALAVHRLIGDVADLVGERFGLRFPRGSVARCERVLGIHRPGENGVSCGHPVCLADLAKGLPQRELLADRERQLISVDRRPSRHETDHCGEKCLIQTYGENRLRIISAMIYFHTHEG